MLSRIRIEVRVRRSYTIAIVILLVGGPSAMAQLPMIAFSGGGGGTRDGGYRGNATFRLPMPPLTVLAGSPYSGEQVDESTQILADGTQITRTTGFHQKAWRDSQGRIRIERPVAPAGNLSGRKGLPTLVVIQDPVAGFSYIMDDVSRVAHRVTLQTRVLPPQRANPVAAVPAPAPSAPPAPVAANPQRPQYSFENLGSQTIDGIQANGTRRTTLYPAGSQGNDAPFTITQEVWTSPDLNLTILTVTADPRQGTTTSKVANLSRSEPDPALFFVPVGYTVVDEAETFTVKWGAN